MIYNPHNGTISFLKDLLFLTALGPPCLESFSPVVCWLFIAVASLVAGRGPQGEQAAVGAAHGSVVAAPGSRPQVQWLWCLSLVAP